MAQKSPVMTLGMPHANDSCRLSGFGFIPYSIEKTMRVWVWLIALNGFSRHRGQDLKADFPETRPAFLVFLSDFVSAIMVAQIQPV